VTSCLVDKATGFCGETLLVGLKQYARQKACSPKHTPSPWTTLAAKKIKNEEAPDEPFSFQWAATA
jgi:hypothetical protein